MFDENPENLVEAYNRVCDEHKKLLSELQEIRNELKGLCICNEALVAALLGRAEVLKAPSHFPEYVVKVDKNILPTLTETEGTEIKKHDIYIICE